MKTSMGGCVGSHHDSSGSLNENSDGPGVPVSPSPAANSPPHPGSSVHLHLPGLRIPRQVSPVFLSYVPCLFYSSAGDTGVRAHPADLPADLSRCATRTACTARPPGTSPMTTSGLNRDFRRRRAIPGRVMGDSGVGESPSVLHLVPRPLRGDEEGLRPGRSRQGSRSSVSRPLTRGSVGGGLFHPVPHLGGRVPVERGGAVGSIPAWAGRPCSQRDLPPRVTHKS
ncbi:uncharacterized protein LOC109067520 isoform X4 [Cyprinus carpio]|uniref:Uncharacterized protein LOC109067520 isoform X4 n=1 Tax=Cyprinus carpio TaxID=7962 RepID=A0A9R0AV49_CYPCA|nr:uncharacterized protein LOC109067520 isoform X4 [Cyprinus carpio]